MLHVFSYRTFLLALLLVSGFSSRPTFAVTSALITPPQNVSTGIKSYIEWKNSKIQSVESKIKSLQYKISELKPNRGITSRDPNLKKNLNSEAGLGRELQAQLEQELLNLSVSRDLTMSDYFVGYLTKQSSLEAAIKDVAGRLTPEEVAVLMSSYAEHFFESRPSALKITPRADSGL